MKKICVFLLMIASSLFAQKEVFGLRVYANNDEYLPPIISRSDQITIEFDVASSLPPNYRIMFRHASIDWKADNNVFVNDKPKLRSESLNYSVAPNGARNYTYRLKNSFPNDKNFVEFTYSGNYLFYIVDHDDNDRILAEGKFILAEQSIPVSMEIENKFHPNSLSPLNQVNAVSLDIHIGEYYSASDEKSIDQTDVRTVHIVKNWDIERPDRIDLYDNDPDTFIDNFIKPDKTFWDRNVLVGNEYRRLDLSSISLYPNNVKASFRSNPDVSRFQWQGGPDANGASKLNAFTGSNSDYLDVEISLRLTEQSQKKIFLVGGFSQWKALPQFEMKMDTLTGLYMTREWMRRGVYDYQYVLGDIDADGNVVDQDWYSLEGNDWRTINRYTALVYYHDRRFGGFDRIIGFIRGRNPGTNEEGKISKVPGEVVNSQPPIIIKKGQ